MTKRSTMAGASIPGAGIALASVHNLRDLGGWPTRSGERVRPGRVYRSAGLDHIEDDDVPPFLELGISRVYDLRTEAEREAQPDRLPEGVEHIILDVLADATGAAPAQLLTVLDDPGAAADMLGDGKAIELFKHGYRQVVNLPSARAAYRRLFGDIAESDQAVSLFHCTTGKDRTGWAAAALLSVLGVSEADVMTDYLLTNEQLLPALKPMLDSFAAHGGDPDLLLPVVGVRREYLDAGFDEMRTRFGSLEGYLLDGLGLPADTIAALKHALLELGDR